MSQNNYTLYKRLLLYSKPYIFRIVVAMIASLGVAGADVTLAKLVQPFIDKVIGDRNVSLVNLVPFFILGIAVVKGVSRYFQEYLIKTSGQLVVQDVRNDLYTHSLSLSMGYFSRTKTGAIMSRILNDVGAMQQAAVNVLVEFVREGFTLVGLVGLAFYQDWRLASIAFLVLPITVVPATIIGRVIKDNTRRGLSTLGKLTSVLQETFSGIKILKAFGTEKVEEQKFRTENLAFYHLIRKTLKYDSLSAPVVEILGSAGIAAVSWYGIHRVFSGAITQGQLMSFVAAVAMMYGPLKRLVKVSNAIQRSVGAAERVFEVFDIVPDIVDPPNAVNLGKAKGAVSFDKVEFAYESESVLRAFTLSANPGEVIALVGPSGAGKTTVVGLLARFYDPQKGVVFVDGQDIRTITQASLKSNIAYVDQETVLFNTSIADNIRYGRLDATDDEVREAARMAYADDFISALPDGYETHIGDRGLRLSGGQRQRICIARALLRNAPILILDEATSALDTESEAMVQKALSNLMMDRTTFVIAHRLSTIMHADKIVVLDQGAISEIGTHAELLKSGGLYRKLYDMQFKD